jgi:hypothetical protein
MLLNRSKNAGIKELEIFDNFIVDKNLPKHKKNDTDERKINFSSNNEGRLSVSTFSNDGDFGDNSNLSFFNRIKIAFTLKKFLQNQKLKMKKELNLITIREFFLNTSKNFKELTPIAEIADYFQNAINQAIKLGQDSLKEKLINQLDVVRGEIILLQMGLKFYINNDQVCSFYEKVDEDKNLKLTWIKNFVKIIPQNLVELKEKIDERKIFDNYVILHYDPHGIATDLTEKELELKKDPILFGVIKNSKKLYYVGDWKDDYCDLTLESMFETLGEKTLTINNKNLKTYIDKI